MTDSAMRHGSLFSGYEGLGMAVNAVFGSTTAWVSDVCKVNKNGTVGHYDPCRSPCSILAHRLPDVPNLGDITTVDWSAVEPVDVLSGGFPCQDVSHAGKRAGLGADTRTGLWSHMAYATEALRPAYVVAENVRGLLSARADSDLEPCPWCMGDGTDEPPLRALGAVLGDLADIGYDARWVGLRAADVGAPHGRFRIFVLATDTRHERAWRATGPGEAGGWWARDHLAGRGIGATSDPASGRDESRTLTAGDRRGRPQASTRGTGSTTPDAALIGRREGWTEPTRLIGRPDAPECGDAAPDAGSQRHGRGQDARGVGPVDREDADGARERKRTREVAGDRGHAATADANHAGLSSVGRLEPIGRDVDRRRSEDIAWGAYEPAIRRWERTLGRPAPAPTQPGRTGNPQLSPRFVEWLMGLPDGWVCDVPGLTRNQMLKALGNGVVPQQAEAALRWLLATERAA